MHTSSGSSTEDSKTVVAGLRQDGVCLELPAMDHAADLVSQLHVLREDSMLPALPVRAEFPNLLCDGNGPVDGVEHEEHELDCCGRLELRLKGTMHEP